MLYFKS